MSKQEKQQPVAIDIDDLTEVVGGAAFAVALPSRLLPTGVSPIGPDALNPGSVMSTVMCPSSKISGGLANRINQF